MTAQFRLVILILLLPILLAGCATSPDPLEDSVRFHIWQHRLGLPTDDMAAFAVTDQTLMIRYQDGARLAVSLIDFISEAVPQDISLTTYMAQLYGDSEPTDPDLRQARSIIDDEVVARNQIAQGELTIYQLVYEDRSSAFVLDSNSDTHYLMIDADGRSLERVLETITRR